MQNLPTAVVKRVLTVVLARPWLVVLVFLLASLCSWHYTSSQLGINADPAAMLDQNLPFLQQEKTISAQFPVFNDSLLVVLRGHDQRQLRQQARQVYQRLQAQPELYPYVFWPAAEAWFQDHALLFQDAAAIQQLSDQLSAAQPLLAMLAEDTSANGLLQLLLLLQTHADTDSAAALAPLYAQISSALLSINSDPATTDISVDWQQLLAGKLGQNAGTQPDQSNSATSSAATIPSAARELIVVQPRLDSGRVLSARVAIEQLQEIRHQLGLSTALTDSSVSMQITGAVALKHEELLSTMQGAVRAGVLATLMVAVLLWLALRSVWMLLAAFLTLTAGFLLTAAFATWAVQEINLITIAFVVLYIGLGINYSIHFILRYQEQLVQQPQRAQAIMSTGQLLVGALSLSAITTMVGFFAFIPTSYQGVAQLGLIAGCSIPITMLAHYTLMPALLHLLPSPAPRRLRSSASGNWLDLPLQHRRLLLSATAFVALLAVSSAVQIRFDSDPLNLRDQQSESVQTVRQLLRDGSGDFRSLMISASDREQALQLSAKLRQVPSVDRVLNAQRLIPGDQQDKLWQLEDLRFLLGDAILEQDWQLAPVDADILFEQMQTLLAQLQSQPQAQQQHADDDPAQDQLHIAQTRLATALERLLAERNVHADTQLAADINQHLLGELPELLSQLQNMLSVSAPVGVEDLPARLREQWIAADGSWLIRIYPAADANQLQQLETFLAEVRQVSDQVTGTVVKQIESGRAISSSFYQALLTALVAISLLLLLLLRSLLMTIRILIPLLLGGCLTMAAMVLLDVPLNFANIIALPLLLGVAVDNGIHLVWRQRLGQLPHGNVLRTATARAIVFAGLTSVISFGNLGFSGHVGTASMGILLATGLLIMIVCTLLVLPALLPQAPDAG